MACLDVDTSIAEFLADAERTSLELPHMTTGQRKTTKKLLEKYPEIRCESYGFGPERQLHLFKKGADETPPEEGKSKVTPFGGSPAMSNREVLPPVALEELQVRNTFIHFERAPVDDRAVQSMPHGMFKQCILAETSKAATGYDTPTTMGYEGTPVHTPRTASEPESLLACPSLSLSVGALVVVEGLVKVPAFNGRSAVVQGWDEATGRYNILFASPDGCQQAKIKEENLRMVLPCP